MSCSMKDVVILIGHGGVAADTPRALVRELKQLEGQRRPGTPMSAREADLDEKVRTWPRTPETDPYRFGLERMAEILRPKVAPAELRIAYNEFCAPSIDEAVERAADDGVARIVLVTTMFTPGGSHAEGEIPLIVGALQKRHPEVSLTYAWPFSLDAATELLANTVRSHAPWAD